MSYRVDNIPLLLKPLFLIYGWVCGTALWLLFAILHFTVRIRVNGREHLPRDRTFILCQWHGNTFAHMVACLFDYSGMILLNHPAWYMKPIHVMFYLMGIKKMILGSTGHGGREAADTLVECLKQGHSTLMFPDGPAGPPFTFYKGTLHISADSNCPVIPVRVRCHHAIHIKSWDDKHLPLPFSRLEVSYEKPIQVTADNFDEALAVIPGLMG